MITDEFEELLGAIAHGSENAKKQNADDVILKTYRFFSKLKEELKTATGDEKEELMGMIKTMQEKVNEYSQKSCEAVGMSESELVRLSDDTDIFTPDQKRVLDMAKRDMMESSKVIRKHLSERQVDHKPTSVGEPDTAPPGTHSKKKKPSKGRSRRRDDWMKS